MAFLLAAWIATSRPVMAQDSAASDALFNKGIADMEAGNYESACPALKESNRLDPRAGTIFALAECEAKWGKLASAVVHYTDYLTAVGFMPPNQRARHRDREAIAQEQIDRLRPQVPQLTLVLPADAPKDTRVVRDGVALMEASLGIALPVDPGKHTIVTQLYDGRKHTEAITIAPGEHRRVDLVVEMPTPTGASRPATAAPPSRAAPPPTQRPESPPRKQTSPSRPWPYVAAGIGLAGLAAGTVTGLMSMGKKKEVDRECEETVCSPEGKAAADSGRTLGNVSTVAFGVGAVGLVSGAVLWLAAPSRPVTESKQSRWQPTAAVGEGRSSLIVGVRGVW